MISKILLDTHALFEFVTEPLENQELQTKLELSRSNSSLFASSFSFWELGLLVQKERIYLKDVSRWCDQVTESSGIVILQPTVHEMVASTKLPWHHKDPFDRVLIAQAKSLNLVVATSDRMFKQYGVRSFWE